jgi:hypothetical protein
VVKITLPMPLPSREGRVRNAFPSREGLVIIPSPLTGEGKGEGVSKGIWKGRFIS